MRKVAKIPIEPKVIKWIRTSDGFKIEDVSKKLKISKDDFQKWESEKTEIEFTTLKRLAKFFKRPVAAFFLSKPLEEPPLPKDFRFLLGKENIFSSQFFQTLREVRRTQTIAKELLHNLGKSTEPNIPPATIKDDPESIADRERERFGISVEEQVSWKSYYIAFKNWRERMEKFNIMVISTAVPLEDTRGFSLADKQPFIIFINSNDVIQARIFTLFHEYAHLILREHAICIPLESLDQRILASKEWKVEQWCNKFSAAFLLPSISFVKELENVKKMPLEKQISKLSRIFKVSKSVVLIKMRALGTINLDLFQKEIERLKEKGIPKIKGFRSPVEKCLYEKGKTFTSLVLENKEKNLISTSDVADFLSIKLKHIKKLSSLV